AAQRLAAIPKRRTLAEIKKVLVVGEIYVRRDNFSVTELSDHLIEQDIFPKLAGVSEWIGYTDWLRRRQLQGNLERMGWWQAIKLGWVGERAFLALEEWWKHKVESDVHAILAPTGFLPDAPIGLDEALAAGCREFISPALESEATLSPAVAAAAMQDGYSGITIIAPFGCLPGRLIEGVFTPWARARGFPVVALENDGQPYPPNVIARLEVFSHNVKRYERRSS
ncbi:MAG: activase, partial [Vicinamibacteria bacterium]|nr:activase [Vicinamibacteria bacterium]